MQNQSRFEEIFVILQQSKNPFGNQTVSNGAGGAKVVRLIRRYVYYKCTQGKDKNCKGQYIEERDLVRQFEGILENVDLHELGVKEKIKKEILRFKKFQKTLLGISDAIKVDSVDVKNYFRFILREGEDMEKRELLACLRSKIELKDKVITLSK